jgi:hypothetical protein
VAFTRFQSIHFPGKYNLGVKLISYGPCLVSVLPFWSAARHHLRLCSPLQTPTLGFCVKRHDEIQSFRPERYWVLSAALAVTGTRSAAAPAEAEEKKRGGGAGAADAGSPAPLTLEWDRGRIFDEEVCACRAPGFAASTNFDCEFVGRSRGCSYRWLPTASM